MYSLNYRTFDTEFRFNVGFASWYLFSYYELNTLTFTDIYKNYTDSCCKIIFFGKFLLWHLIEQHMHPIWQAWILYVGTMFSTVELSL
jgi:hypothetical protein